MCSTTSSHSSLIRRSTLLVLLDIVFVPYPLDVHPTFPQVVHQFVHLPLLLLLLLDYLHQLPYLPLILHFYVLLGLTQNRLSLLFCCSLHLVLFLTQSQQTLLSYLRHNLLKLDDNLLMDTIIKVLPTLVE